MPPPSAGDPHSPPPTQSANDRCPIKTTATTVQPKAILKKNKIGERRSRRTRKIDHHFVSCESEGLKFGDEKTNAHLTVRSPTQIEGENGKSNQLHNLTNTIKSKTPITNKLIEQKSGTPNQEKVKFGTAINLKPFREKLKEGNADFQLYDNRVNNLISDIVDVKIPTSTATQHKHILNDELVSQDCEIESKRDEIQSKLNENNFKKYDSRLGRNHTENEASRKAPVSINLFHISQNENISTINKTTNTDSENDTSKSLYINSLLNLNVDKDVLSDCKSQKTQKIRRKVKKKRVQVTSKATQTIVSSCKVNKIPRNGILQADERLQPPPPPTPTSIVTPQLESSVTPDSIITALTDLITLDPECKVNNVPFILRPFQDLQLPTTSHDSFASIGSDSSRYPSSKYSFCSSEPSSFSLYCSDDISNSSTSLLPSSSIDTSNYASSITLSSKNSSNSIHPPSNISECSITATPSSTSSTSSLSSSIESQSSDSHPTSRHVATSALQSNRLQDEVIFNDNRINTDSNNLVISDIKLNHSPNPNKYHSETVQDIFLISDIKNEFKCGSNNLKMEERQEELFIPTGQKKVEITDHEILSVNNLPEKLFSARDNQQFSDIANSHNVNSTPLKQAPIKTVSTRKRDENIFSSLRSSDDRTFPLSRNRSISPSDLGRVKNYSRFQLGGLLNESIQVRSGFNDVSILSDFSTPEYPRSPIDTSPRINNNVPRFPQFSPSFIKSSSTKEDLSDNDDINFSINSKDDSTNTFLKRLSSLLNLVCVRTVNDNLGVSRAESADSRNHFYGKHIKTSLSCLSCYRRQNSDSSVHDNSSTNIRKRHTYPVKQQLCEPDYNAEVQGSANGFKNPRLKVWSLSSSNDSAVSISGSKAQSDFSSVVSTDKKEVFRSDSPIVVGHTKTIQVLEKSVRSNLNGGTYKSQTQFSTTSDRLRYKFSGSITAERESHYYENVPLILSVPVDAQESMTIPKNKSTVTLETHYENPEEYSSINYPVSDNSSFPSRSSGSSEDTSCDSDDEISDKSSEINRSFLSLNKGSSLSDEKSESNVENNNLIPIVLNNSEYCDESSTDISNSSQISESAVNTSNLGNPRKIAALATQELDDSNFNSNVIESKNRSLNIESLESSNLDRSHQKKNVPDPETQEESNKLMYTNNQKSILRNSSDNSILKSVIGRSTIQKLVISHFPIQNQHENYGFRRKSSNDLSKQMKQHMINLRKLNYKSSTRG